MRSISIRCRDIVLLCVALTAAAQVEAQIIIGQTAGFSGPVAEAVKEATFGAHLYIDAVNARGGINGQPIQLLSVDDKFKPDLSAQNARALAEKGAIALFLSRGTPNTQAILPVLAEFKLPLIAPSTGAMVLHQPVNQYIFNVRSSYQREAQRVIQHLAQVGVRSIAIVRADDSFGSDAFIGATRGFTDVNQKPVLDEKFDRFKPDFSAIAPKLKQSGAMAVLFICSGSTLAEGAKAFRAAGSNAQIVTLSNNASIGIIKQMGVNARGTIVSQVFPDEKRSMAAPLIREALELARAKKVDALSPAMVEGFAGAKVLVEGLRRAGPRPTRESLLIALNGMHKYDIGGMEMNYSQSSHTGLDFVDLSIIKVDGNFMR
ncbi:MAG: ABC transporter substrate-binding protein [Pseudomonadota bacterium]|nr:ABC transporter substrate-binding protein [Pseudomonadota bacterium]